MTILSTRIKELAELQRCIKQAYALDHTSPEHQAIKAKWPIRDMYANELTALHIVLAELRGKTHCDVVKWSAGCWYSKRLLDDARALLQVAA